MSRLNSENFIEKAKEIHGDKYLYDKVIYINNYKKVEIICPKHGPFWVTPNHHITSKSGCPTCSGCIRKSNKQFIDEAKLVHGDKYDYSKVEYKNNKTKVCIICPEHGEFWQIPYDHLRGIGCSKCYHKKRGKDQTLTQEVFLNRCIDKHGYKYDYSKSIYINMKTPVLIFCPIHGEFYQKPYDHLRGEGCPKCGRFKANDSNSYSQDDFVKKCSKIHNNKYDYSLVKYHRSNDIVAIICPEHGVFQQRAANHLIGQGCTKCANEKIADAIRSNTEEFVKKAKIIHGDKYDYSFVNYTSSKDKVTIICKKHGEFNQIAGTHLSGGGCPKCILKSQHILFEKLTNFFNTETFTWEYRAHWLKNKRIDICLEKHKIAIEYDGQQHFYPIDHFGGEKEFKNRIKNDALKERLCEENGFKLFRVKYNYTDEDFYNLCVEIQKIIDNGEN